MKHSVLDALNGEGGGLTDRFLSGFSEIEQWSATASVVGAASGERFSPVKRPERNGELWLQEVQLTSWRILYAAQVTMSWELHEAFREDWKSI